MCTSRAATKTIFSLQQIQFWAGMFKTIYAIYLDCGYPLHYNYALVAYMMSHILLFSNFYYQTYHRKAHSKKLDLNNDSSTSKTNGSYVNGSDSSRLRKLNS